MAQQKYYKPYGALEVKAGSEYTVANIPVGTDIVELLRGVRIADEKGEKIITVSMIGYQVQKLPISLKIGDNQVE